MLPAKARTAAPLSFPTVFPSAAVARPAGGRLYVLQGLYQACVHRWGLNKGKVFGLDHVWQLWLGAAVLALALWPAVRWFAALKARRRDWRWLKYF